MEQTPRRDGAWFDDFFRTNAPAVYRMLAHRIGTDAAEDALSQVFVTAFQRRETLSEEGSALPWLYAIANNVIRNHRRSERRHLARMARAAEQAPALELRSSDAVEDRLDARDRLARVNRALRKMPKRQRDALWLLALCDGSYADVATTLGVPVGTVKSRVHSARRRLERELEP